MIDDAELLRRYAEARSEAAFAAFVERHFSLVYFAALRRANGNTALAKDVAQYVFTTVAHEAAALAPHATVTGWLYTIARNAAAKAVRAEQVRQRHAQALELHLMQTNASEPAADEWTRLRPVIDESLEALNAREREAVLLRFFEGHAFAEIGAALKISEDAARMRVERALDKLHRLLARRGVTSTAAALAGVLASQAGVAAPAGLAASVTGAALAGTVTAGSGVAMTVKVLNFMSTTKTVSGVAGVVALLAVGTAVYQTGRVRESTAAFEAERDSLRAQLAAMAKRAEQAGASLTAAQKELGEFRDGRRSEATASGTGTKPDKTMSDPAQIAEIMKRAGMPGIVISRAVYAAVKLKHLSERFAIEGIENGKRSVPRHEITLQLTREQTAQLKALEARETAEIDALTGGPVEDVLQMRADAVKKKYGDLSPEKIAAVQKIEADYQAIVRGVSEGSDGGKPLSGEERVKLAMEKEADIRRALTPEEATDYFRYNSDAASQLKAQIENFHVNDATYIKLADAAIAGEEARRLNAGNSQAVFDLRTNLFGKYRTILGDGDFLLMAKPLDPAAGSLLPAYQAAQLPPEQQVKLFFEARRAYFTLSAASFSEKQAIAAQAYNALTAGAGLSPQQTANFDRTAFGAILKKTALDKP